MQTRWRSIASCALVLSLPAHAEHTKPVPYLPKGAGEFSTAVLERGAGQAAGCPEDGANGHLHLFASWSPVGLADGPVSCVEAGSCNTRTLPLPGDGASTTRATFTDNLTATLPGGRVVVVGLTSICQTGKPPPFTCPGTVKGPFTAQQGCNEGEYLAERSLSVRVSGDCGKHWSVHGLPASDIDKWSGLSGHRFIDRPEIAVDPHDGGTVYLSMRLADTVRYPCDGYGDNRVVVLKGTLEASKQETIWWKHLATLNLSPAVTPIAPIASAVAFYNCNGNTPTAYFTQPVGPPLPLPLNVGPLAEPAYACGNTGLIVRNNSSAAIVESPLENAARVLYAGVHDGYQVLHMIDVANAGPLGYLIEVLLGERPHTIDESAEKRHATFAQLLTTAPLGGDGAKDHTMLLHWSSVGADNRVEERVQVQDEDGGHGTTETLASWKLPGSGCTGAKPCWIGDYHYGSVIDRATASGTTTLRFLVGWTQLEGDGSLQTYASIVTVRHGAHAPVRAKQLHALQPVAPVASTMVLRPEQQVSQPP
jgi:hypothetical protein